MKPPRTPFLLLLFISTLLSGARAGTFCRFEHNGTTAYGQLIDGRIHVLTSAPWQSLQTTGTVYALDQIHLLAPSEPRLIAGLIAAYRSAWPDGGEPPAIRWFFKPRPKGFRHVRQHRLSGA